MNGTIGKARGSAKRAGRNQMVSSIEGVELWLVCVLKSHHKHRVRFEDFLGNFAEDLRASQTKEQAIEAGEKLLALIAAMPELLSDYAEFRETFH